MRKNYLFLLLIPLFILSACSRENKNPESQNQGPEDESSAAEVQNFEVVEQIVVPEEEQVILLEQQQPESENFDALAVNLEGINNISVFREPASFPLSAEDLAACSSKNNAAYYQEILSDLAAKPSFTYNFYYKDSPSDLFQIMTFANVQKYRSDNFFAGDFPDCSLADGSKLVALISNENSLAFVKSCNDNKKCSDLQEFLKDKIFLR